MLVLCYPKCSTCRKALKWLDEHQISYATRDIKAENPTSEELHEWHAMSGQTLRKLFNTSGQQYRLMQLKDKLPSMAEGEMYDLLSLDGMLVKRPLVIGDDFVLIGFKEKEWEERLL